MTEKIITILIVGAAAVWLGYSLYRAASGKAKSGCHGCGMRDKCGIDKKEHNER